MVIREQSVSHYLEELELLVVTLSRAAGLSGQSYPGVVIDLLQEIAVLCNLLQIPTWRILGKSRGLDPVQVTANLPFHKLQHTLGELQWGQELIVPGPGDSKLGLEIQDASKCIHCKGDKWLSDF